MRILIAVDLEGASGVVSLQELGADAAGRYLEARRWLTGDVNAAIEGAMEAGADAFVAHDAHGNDARNLLLDDLHPALEVVAGRPLMLLEEADLARGYDGCFLIGMHARAGAGGVLSHALDWALVRQVRLNGRPVGESELTVSLAAAYDIPTVLITGDDQVCLDVQRWSAGSIEAAVVKYALSRYAARCLPLIEARERIRTAAARAVQRLAQARPQRVSTPILLEVEFSEREPARCAAHMPQVAYDGDCTLSFATEDYRLVYRALLAMLWCARGARA